MRFTRIKSDGLYNTIRLPRLGKIRLGVKVLSKSGAERPKETSFFVCPQEVQARFGSEPTKLPVMLATEDDEQNYRQYFASYGSNQRLKCQGDGQDAERRNEKGEIERIVCPTPERCDFAKQHGCTKRFDLLVVIPDVSVGGVWQISTGSGSADVDIRSGFAMAQSLYGRKSWVPLEIVREPVKMPEPGTTKMQTHYIVRLRPIGDLNTVMAVRKDPMLIPTGETARYLLPEPQIEGPEAESPIVLTEAEEEPQGQPATANVAAQATPAATETPEQAKANGDNLIGLVNDQTEEDLVRDIWRTVLPEVQSLPEAERVRATQAYLTKLKTFQVARPAGAKRH